MAKYGGIGVMTNRGERGTNLIDSGAEPGIGDREKFPTTSGRAIQPVATKNWMGRSLGERVKVLKLIALLAFIVSGVGFFI